MRLAPVFTGLFLVLVAIVDATALDLASLRDPRPTGWSLDHSGRLSQDTRDTLDALGRAVKGRTGHELVVVAVASTDGENQRAFATRLFNRWQLGDRTRNDGVLLFVALSDRRVEFVLGDGIDNDQQVAISQTIVDQDMIPRFRAGDPQMAVVAGARACAERILGLTSANVPNASTSSTPQATTTNLTITGDRVHLQDLPVERDTSLPEANGPVYPYAPQSPTAPPYSSPKPTGSDSAWQILSLAGGGSGGLAGFYFWRRWLRNRPRVCNRCQHPMIRLGESEDDQHLNHSEKTEERVGSVDYDIWCCTSCPHVLKLRYGTWFTSYARCPQCNAVTKSSNETTLVAATYDHGGQVRVDEACVACDYRNSFTRSTPRKTRPQSNSGGRSGGSSSGRGGGGSW